MSTSLAQRAIRACGTRGTFVARAPLPQRALARVPRAAFREQNHTDADAASTSGSGVPTVPAGPALAASLALLLLSEAGPAAAADAASPFEGVTANSLYVTLALFLMSVPGIWSQVKRAPKANRKRKTFEVPGPGVPGAMPVDDRARQLFQYFKSYNYKVKETGEVITFEGLYAADKGQAAAVTFYTFCGMGCVALVLSILYPQIGNGWYVLTAVSPAAAWYYFQRGERTEEVKLKMVTSDDDKTTDIIVEGDQEEIARLAKELGLVEKGMVYVKGILEQ